MFGYVRPLRDEMKVRDWNLWQQHYCGLCRCLGKRHGFAARFLLSYDMTFLSSLLAMAEPPGKARRCWCPSRVVCRRACRPADAAAEFAADLTVLLAWHKLRDEIRDGGFFRRIGARIACLFYRRAYHRAARFRPEQDACIREHLLRLHELETANCDSIDRTADAFASILRGFALWWQESALQRPAAQLLYHVGRFVYLADALDDLAEDCRTGAYNPLRFRFHTEQGRLLPEDKAYLLEVMNASLDLAASAFELMPRAAGGAVPENIIYYGLPGVLKLVSEGKFHKKKKVKQ